MKIPAIEDIARKANEFINSVTDKNGVVAPIMVPALLFAATRLGHLGGISREDVHELVDFAYSLSEKSGTEEDEDEEEIVK